MIDIYNELLILINHKLEYIGKYIKHKQYRKLLYDNIVPVSNFLYRCDLITFEQCYNIYITLSLLIQYDKPFN